MTDTEINRLAAEAIDCWHDEGHPDNARTLKRCTKCHRYPYDSFTDGVNPDYCNDRNAAARLVEKCDEGVFHQSLRELAQVSGTKTVSLAVWAYQQPKFVALAALVAMGKITIEEAKQ